jgi:23S rRNA pseudouridine2605 synthase
VSLPRAISKLGFASRTQAGRLIADGSVKVNGRVEVNPHRWVDIENDRIEIQSQTLRPEPFRYVVIHKPAGVVTTVTDELGGRTVFDILGEPGKGLSPVGRLDKDTTGLLLFTNDHQLAHRVTSPETGLAKRYVVRLDRPIVESDRQTLADGMEISIDGHGIMTRPARIALKEMGEIEIAITEGKNRQVRRMFGELGYEVTTLHRLSIGPLHLGDLAEGECRELTGAELAALKSAVGEPAAKMAAQIPVVRVPRRDPVHQTRAGRARKSRPTHSKFHPRNQRKKSGASHRKPGR